MANVVQPKQVIVYADPADHEPFTEWLHGLRDRQGRQRILVRIGRLEHDNYGSTGTRGLANHLPGRFDKIVRSTKPTFPEDLPVNSMNS